MLYALCLIFTLSIAVIFVLLKNKLKQNYYLYVNDLLSLENNFSDLALEEKRIKEENLRKDEKINKTINLYEMSKEIYEFLEEDKIFYSFKNGLRKFVYFDECNYLVNIDSSLDLGSFEIIPLKLEDENFGYLAIRGLKQEDKRDIEIPIFQFIASIKRARLYRQIQELSITDFLTRIFTHKYSLDRLKEELQRSQELNLTLSFLMVDIDNFKSFNDKYGHLVGDAILKNVADIIKLNCREIDLIGRFGGEEFLVILPMTSKDGALFVGERIRKSIESAQIKAFDEVVNVTVSIGTASFPEDAKTSVELIDKSDWALYRSKRTGKNRVSAYARYK